MNFDINKDAAHLQSNYSQWKKRVIASMQVDIDLSKAGVSTKKVKLLCDGISYCVYNQKTFALYTDDGESVVTFFPETLSSVQKTIVTASINPLQFMNQIKLIALTHHNIYIPPPEPPKEEKKIILLP